MSSELADQSPAQLRELITAALAELSGRDDPACFAELLTVNQALGVAMGSSARILAEAGSWARVADVAGTTRQAAWSRWSQ